MADFGGDEGGLSPFQTVDKKLIPPEGGLALSANKRTAEFFDFVLQAKFAYVNKLRRAEPAYTSAIVCKTSKIYPRGQSLRDF